MPPVEKPPVSEVFLPSTYAHAVPYDLYDRLRREAPVCRIPEPAVGPWREGPGYWGVFRHADVKHVLRAADDFSSHLGATQIRDPDTPADLAFVRAMMLNTDPPDHSRLRRIVAAAFTPRAVRALERTIAERAASLFAAGVCDFVEVAADLPVWTLAHVMGVPDEDRRLLYDWASRVIGYQDADYAGLSTADAESLSPIGRLAIASRPRLGPGVNPRSRAALADMFAYAHALGKSAHGESVMSAMRDGGLTEAEFENMFFLFAVAGNETLRNGIPGGLLTLLQHPAPVRPGCAPTPRCWVRRWRRYCGSGRRSWTSGGRPPVTSCSAAGASRGREGCRLSRLRQPRPGRLLRPRPLRRRPRPERPRQFRLRPALLPRRPPRAGPAALGLQTNCSPGTSSSRAGPIRLTSNFQNGLK